MTNNMMDLRSLVEKSADADLLREMIGFAAEKLMELEVGAKTGAAYGEKNDFGVRTRAVRNRTLRANGMRTYAARRSPAGRRSGRNPLGI